jgi:hypothetical protein
MAKKTETKVEEAKAEVTKAEETKAEEKNEVVIEWNGEDKGYSMQDIFNALSKAKYKTQKKNHLDYISWANAYRGVMKHFANDFQYKVLKDPNTLLPYFQSEGGAMVFTEVTIGGNTREMWLPVMDFKGGAVTKPNMVQVNKAIMRCLAKNIAMFGLGLELYAGEDIPDEKDSSDSPTSSTFGDSRSKGSVKDTAMPEQVKLVNDLIKSVSEKASLKTGTVVTEDVVRDKAKATIGEEINIKMSRDGAFNCIQILQKWEDEYAKE